MSKYTNTTYVYASEQTGVYLRIGEVSTNDKKVNIAFLEVTDIVDQDESFSVDRSIKRYIPILRRVFFLFSFFSSFLACRSTELSKSFQEFRSGHHVSNSPVP